MILRISDDLARKIKDRPTRVLPLDRNPYADWSTRLFAESRTQYIMITNTVSLYTMVMFGAGIHDALTFTSRVTSYISEFTRADGFELIYERLISPSTLHVSFSKALNRRVTGSMNDLEFQAKIILARGTVSPWDVSLTLNEIPFSYLKYNGPRVEFHRMGLETGVSN
ncbi:hypothetical protein MELA_01277 [Candidatus Methylomirabilis lanthanidiphila]|uniref:DUF6933 domain-containing protein n=1 Tax=Candidatus Methylomirabilis lanthanidiphila TaxID=2211376 RepID=A0A564ZJU2_9BACT|nr:hypothetical protein [Candidatus Methylomirabilis lanthanidiphila]VUZ84902.1 hypothetical protein MELA_01277 [Candidatus Methylomirabilis lanthanidiphila]